MKPLALPLRTARKLHLAAQGLLTAPPRKTSYAAMLATIRRMSLLQIDAIHVVARSPYLVLFSRLGAYTEHWLDEALVAGDLFEYWAHEACFIPSDDYKLLRHKMHEPDTLGWKYNRQWMVQHADEVTDLLAYIEKNGPVRAADFTTTVAHNPGWWAWKPHKRHLENLFTAGEVMVVERRNFQRVYDLRTRVLPTWDDKQHMLSKDTAVAQMLRNSAQSLGIFRPDWLKDYYRLKHAPVKMMVAQWLAEGTVTEVMVEHLGTLYLHRDLLPLLETPLKATHTAILSPFDPLVWDRRRALELFNFDYRLECYTPQAKRKYGYFVLPILHQGALKARLDAKMVRKEKVLQIKNIWFEADVKITASLINDLRHTITRFASWQGAERVMLGKAPDVLRAEWGYEWEIASTQAS